MDAIETDPTKRAAKVAAAFGRQDAAAGAGLAPRAPAPRPQEAEPPKPMKEDPPGSGPMVVDTVAYDRMYPGGAKLNVRAFKVCSEEFRESMHHAGLVLKQEVHPAGLIFSVVYMWNVKMSATSPSEREPTRASRFLKVRAFRALAGTKMSVEAEVCETSLAKYLVL